MSNKKTLTISILGKNYSIVTDEDSKTVEDAATLIDSHLRKLISTTSSPVEAAKKTTLVALQVAVDLLKTKRKLDHNRLEIEKKQQELDMVGVKTATLNELLKEV